MSYHYDLMLTLREAVQPEDIIKQYIAKNVSFPNPVSSGDFIHIEDEGSTFCSEPVKVHHSPKPTSKSKIYADIKVLSGTLSKIEEMIEKYNFQKF